jgi:triosephosphate isomerase (TIM)
VGHSERRTGFGFSGEPDAVVAAKVKTAITGGLNVIACVGEQLSEREGGLTMKVVSTQLAAMSAVLSPAEWGKVVLAYEPVWAIGTGKVATPEQAEETHAQIRDWFAQNVSPEVAANIRIIYGGSVKGSNAESLLLGPNIDGFLVGGASLLPEFVNIIQVGDFIPFAISIKII